MQLVLVHQFRISHTLELNDVEILQMLSESWFSRVRSTSDMVAGTKNEEAVLKAFWKHDQVADLWECGLFEGKKYPTTTYLSSAA